jgi:GNAT superfamily N-acetyltransferase
VIEPLAPRDREACIDLAARVGWTPEPAKWDVFFALGRGFGIRGADGKLTSTVMLPEHDDATFVAMMIVDPALQGKGHARTLLSHALGQARPPAMLYATPAGRPLYDRLGFVEVDRVRKFIGVAAKAAKTVSNHATVRDGGCEDLARIVDHDAAAFGLRRSRMIRVLLARAERVVKDDRGGFALRWHSGDLHVVGPVVAQDPAAAMNLVDAALVGATGRVRIDVRSPSLAEHVRTTIGLQELETAPLMTWPSALALGERSRYHAIALQGLG